MDPKVADPSAIHGLFVLAGAQPLSATSTGQKIQQYLLQNPDVCGATVFANWSRVDNGPGSSSRYNWSSIDRVLGKYKAAHVD